MAVDVVTVGVLCADVMVRPVDSFPKTGTGTLLPTLELHVGGLAAATAEVLSALGTKAALVGRIGCDGFGDFIYNTLQSRGVDVSALRRDSDRGTSATVVLINSEGERTFLHCVGATAALNPEDLPEELLDHARLVHWGGPGLTPGLDGQPMGRIMARLKAKGITTSIDTVFVSTDVWLPYIEPALPYVDIFMASENEAKRYTGKDAPDAMADFFIERGVQTVLIKLGANGMFATDGEHAHHVPAHAVQPIDTTGAGDAACAGFLHGYLEGWDLLKCTRFANAVGGLTVQSMGGGDAIHSREQVMTFMGSN